MALEVVLVELVVEVVVVLVELVVEVVGTEPFPGEVLREGLRAPTPQPPSPPVACAEWRRMFILILRQLFYRRKCFLSLPRKHANNVLRVQGGDKRQRYIV